MLEQLKFLIDFQVLEDKKTQVTRSRQDIPKRMAELQKEFDQYEAVYLSKMAEQDQMRKLHESLELIVADLGARIARSRQRLSEVKTNKEYQAMLREVDDLKKEMTGKEDDMLAIMEKVEAMKGELAALEKGMEERRKVQEEQKKQLDEENGRLSERLEYLDGLQQTVRDKIEPALLKRTNFLLTKQFGIAVAAVENGVCQVCHLNIPPQKFIELQRDEHIHQCPHCHRFLYWPGHEGYTVFEEGFKEL